jgi:hypothetical protein
MTELLCGDHTEACPNQRINNRTSDLLLSRRCKKGWKAQRNYYKRSKGDLAVADEKWQEDARLSFS